ncbi:nicotinate-nucleotide--dimethylbenzimidazole phosphoribosyltransferase [Aquibium oceanicum]|uniref:Nicotinate-nucleotide--dimethylbenzimidazole phosphoribosyltransferase n=1 Tax=Aquibium oceanicum TaxID=1670800 RepID=A0A1L3SRV9_9HYPH|nr:nicotinate-nucleotide--dimethylbenzimidazole phosphoribosyltransferase [Aquibium oceanicum]APH72042.1 nicotinate-nucleotide--dimethylbenzimidazole phosphoribosyltransferase [Aquibium oceanicum]
MTTGIPFDDFRVLAANVADPGDEIRRTARARLERVDPDGRLGVLGDTALWLAIWSGRMPPAVNRPQLAVFAGNHGVARHGVSARPVSATAALVEHCAAGGAPVNQLCVANDVGLKVYDLALDLATGDITTEPALDERGAAATMAFGMEATADGMDLLCIGSIGVGGSTSSAAVLAALFGGDTREWVPAEADGLVYDRKVSAVGRALETHAGRLGDPFEVLRRLGGRESAAIVGAILAARAQKIPVILDGLTATAAAAALHAANPRAVEHCRLATAPSAPVHRRAAERAGVQAVLSIDLDLQAGAGAALAVGFVKSAALCLAGMQPLPGSV